MSLLLYILLWTACIFSADTTNTKQNKSTTKLIPVGLRHLEELKDLPSSEEFADIEKELQSMLPRTPANRRDPVICDLEEKHADHYSEQQQDPMRTIIEQLYADYGMKATFFNDYCQE